MPVIEGGQVLRGGQDFGGVLGGQVIYGGQEIEAEQGGRTQPDSEAVEMSVGPFRRSGAPPNGWYNGVADKGATAVDIVTGTHYTNTGTKAATVWTVDAPSGGGSGGLFLSESNFGGASFGPDGAGVTHALDWDDGWTVVNEGGFTLQSDTTRLALPAAGLYEIFASGQVTTGAEAENGLILIEVVGENLGDDFTGNQGYLQSLAALTISHDFRWRAVEQLAATALVGLKFQSTENHALIGKLHVGIRPL